MVGFDDIPIAAHTVPALTTLRMPITEMVREGVRQAVGFAQDPTAPREARVQSFDPTLVVRESTAPPRGPRPDDRHGPGRVGRPDAARAGQPPVSAGDATGIQIRIASTGRWAHEK